MKDLDIIKTFLLLTSHVVPHGYEEKWIVPNLRNSLNIPEIMERDGFGNCFVKIGESETLFCSHLDTVGEFDHEIERLIVDGFIVTNGKTILGGDNKAGVTIMINMINNNVPGLYYFFMGEEKGCLGSNWLLKTNRELLSKYKRAIAFDRREKGSIITYQRSRRSASDEFAIALSVEFSVHGMEYKPDPNGISTDTAVFVDIIPECTNLSAGVYGEHTPSEKLDVEYFLKLNEAVIKIDWENLPSTRRAGTYEYARTNNIAVHINSLFDQNELDDMEYMSSGMFPTSIEMRRASEVLFGKKYVNRLHIPEDEEFSIFTEYESIYSDFMYLSETLNGNGYNTREKFKVEKNITFKAYVFYDEFTFTMQINWKRQLILNEDTLIEWEELLSTIEALHNDYDKKEKESRQSPEHNIPHGYVMSIKKNQNSENMRFLVRKEKLGISPSAIWNFSLNIDGTITTHAAVHLDNMYLEFLPYVFKKVYHNFFVYKNKLLSLFGSPVHVNRNFNCSSNKLVNTDYAPLYVGGNFVCYGNSLPNIIESYPMSIIKGDMICDEKNNKLFSEIHGIIKKNYIDFQEILDNPLLDRLEMKSEFYKLVAKLMEQKNKPKKSVQNNTEEVPEVVVAD